MKEIIFLNGRFLRPQEAKISVLTPGFLSGFGLFESMRASEGKIVYLDAHLERIMRSAKIIGIKFPSALRQTKNIIQKALNLSGFADAYVRLTLWGKDGGADILLTVKKYKPYSLKKYQRGFRAAVSAFRQNKDSLLAGQKTTNRLLYELSFQAAKRRGFDEAIILNQLGFIAEASRSNVFFIKDKQLFTPLLTCGCLAGITRRAIFDLAKKYNIVVEEGDFTRQDLLKADEAFLTNSLMGVMPLVSLERKKIGQGKCGKLSEFLKKKYGSLLG